MNQPPIEPSENELPDDVLRRAIASLREEAIPAGPPQDLVAATLQALRESEPVVLSFPPQFSRIKTMRFLTTAAGLLLMVGAVSLLVLSPKAPSTAFGQAIKQVRLAHSMSYTTQMTVAGQKEPIRTKEFIAADGRSRSEMPKAGVTTICDAAGHARITLLQETKRAIVSDQTKNDDVKSADRGFLAWLQALKKLGDKPDKELGEKQLDGKQVTGFVATQGNFTFTMWVDVATREPVLIEYDPQVNDSNYQHVTMTDFRFDEKLDESLFDFTVPPGYTVQQQLAVPPVPGGETSIIEALRGWTKRDAGKFPPSIADWSPWVVLFSKGSRDGNLDPETTRIMANLGSIIPFLVAMPKDSYAYLGKGKTTEEKDAIVFWYKKPDGTYRAIYGDLSAKDITADDVPKK
jgi:outer membrane lipoprotein-sorting protein